MNLPGAPRLALALSLAAGWLNVPGAPPPRALSGKAVVFAFGDFSRAAGLRGLPGLEKLASAHPDALAVVCVQEGRVPRPLLRKLIVDEDIPFPVAVDAGGRLARAYGAAAAPPSFLLIDPLGRPAGRYLAAGEDLEQGVASVLAKAGATPRPGKRPLALRLERDAAGSAAFSPRRLLVDPAGRRVFISDTGHDRVVVADYSGRVLSVIGSGERGLQDGPFAQAKLDHPLGLALNGRMLYIADRGNDRIRQADLAQGMLRTVGQTVGVGWPDGLAFGNDRLYIAAASPHKIMMYNTHDGALSAYAGSGADRHEDGALPAAALEQPAALAFSSGTLFVSDDAAGSVGAVEVANPEIRTMVSGLGWPQGLAASGGSLVVADLGRGTVERVDPRARKATVLARGFSRPEDVAPFRGGWLVADGSGALWRLSADGSRRERWTLSGLPALSGDPQTGPMPTPLMSVLPVARVHSDAPATILLSVSLPKGYRLDARAPFRYRVAQTSGLITFQHSTRKGALAQAQLPARLNFVQPAGRAEALVEASFYYCREDGKGVCLAKSALEDLPLEASPTEPRTELAVSIAAD